MMASNEGAPAMQESQDVPRDQAGLKYAKDMSAAAQRALTEAKARHAKHPPGADLRTEIGGRGGPEPVRYGDWEVKGIATDF